MSEDPHVRLEKIMENARLLTSLANTALDERDALEIKLNQSNAYNSEYQIIIELYGSAMQELFPDFRANGEPIEVVQKYVKHLKAKMKKLQQALEAADELYGEGVCRCLDENIDQPCGWCRASDAYIKFRRKIPSKTCDHCLAKTCESRDDDYNTNGDCLETK